MIKIIGVGFIVVFISLLLKKDKPEIALVVSIAGSIMISILILTNLTDLLNFVNEISGKTSISSSLIKTIFKVVAIAYLAEFSAGVAEDAGSKSISVKILFGAKVLILIVCLPVLKSIFELLIELLN